MPVDLEALRDAKLAALMAYQANRIAQLETALKEAMGWNWLDEEQPPESVVSMCEKALGSS